MSRCLAACTCKCPVSGCQLTPPQGGSGGKERVSLLCVKGRDPEGPLELVLGPLLLPAIPVASVLALGGAPTGQCKHFSLPVFSGTCCRGCGEGPTASWAPGHLLTAAGGTWHKRARPLPTCLSLLSLIPHRLSLPEEIRWTGSAKLFIQMLPLGPTARATPVHGLPPGRPRTERLCKDSFSVQGTRPSHLLFASLTVEP